MKFLSNITLPLALLNIYALNAMQPANLLERLDDQHRQEFTKLKDAYEKGTKSVYYKPSLERSQKNNSSKKATDIIKGHDTDTLITFLAESKLFWISEKQRAFLLHKAAAAGYTAFCQLLVDVKEFPVNAQDKQGCTPLHIAAVKRDLATCMALLHYGARIDIRNKAARSPAQEALLLAEVNKPYELKDIITLLHQEADITLSAPQKKVGSLFNAIAFHVNQDSICTRLRLVITVDDRLTNQDEMGQTILHRLEKYLESAFSGYEEKYYCNDSRRAMRCQAATNIVTSLVSEYANYLESHKSPEDASLITDDGKKMLLRSLLALQDTNGQSASNIALLITDDTDPASIETCKMVLRKSKGLSGELTKTFNPLYIAAMDRESATLTELVLTTCPSIKPSLKLVWLVYRRLGLFLPKVVLRQCIAPFVIYNVTNTQLATLQQLANQNTLSDISGRVKGTTLKNLLDPLKIEQHRATITAELYATITPKPANN